MPGQRYSKPTLTTLDVCLGVTCRLHFWQNDRGLLHATAVTRGVEWTPTKLALEVNSGEENSPATPAAIRTRNLSITSLTLSPTSCPVHFFTHINT